VVFTWHSLQRFRTATTGCACTPWNECEDPYLRSSVKRSASIDTIQVTQCDSGGGEQLALKTGRLSLTGVYVWSVNSIVTKHSDYFVWKDTSECVTRCCDDNSWQKASEFLCIKTHLFLRESSNKKIHQKPPEILFPTCYHYNVFKFSRQLHAVFWNHASRGFR